MMNIRLVIIIVASFVIGATAALLIHPSTQSILFSAANVQTSGKALIGGPFTLTNHKGERVTHKDFQGRFMLVYFGYTYCPDICPAELQVIAAALDKLGPKADRITPIFITVDPERDTVPRMAEYVSHFHKQLIGLTGTNEEIRAVAKAYRVYFAKAKKDTSATDYLMDHSSIIYVMNNKGDYVTHLSYGTSAEKIAEKLEKLL